MRNKLMISAICSTAKCTKLFEIFHQKFGIPLLYPNNIAEQINETSQRTSRRYTFTKKVSASKKGGNNIG